jgi:hypothetical protein
MLSRNTPIRSAETIRITHEARQRHQTTRMLSLIHFERCKENSVKAILLGVLFSFFAMGGTYFANPAHKDEEHSRFMIIYTLISMIIFNGLNATIYTDDPNPDDVTNLYFHLREIAPQDSTRITPLSKNEIDNPSTEMQRAASIEINRLANELKDSDEISCLICRDQVYPCISHGTAVHTYIEKDDKNPARFSSLMHSTCGKAYEARKTKGNALKDPKGNSELVLLTPTKKHFEFFKLPLAECLKAAAQEEPVTTPAPD